jgi:hypothetical protein
MASTIQVDKVQDTGGNTILSSNSTGTFTYEAASGANFTALDAGNVSAGTLAVARGGTGTTSYSPGITEADSWRLTTDFTGDADPVASNLERDDTYGNGIIGTGMTESSGIFTFPSTGIWLVRGTVFLYANNSANYADVYIKVTTNNSDYNTSSKGEAYAGSGDYGKGSAWKILDVTDTSNVKVKFTILNADNSNTTRGDTDANETDFQFIRLGDT